MTDQMQPLHRVRVWFGSYVIADWTGPAGQAEGYAAFMAHRFASLNLRVQNEPITDQLTGVH